MRSSHSLNGVRTFRRQTICRQNRRFADTSQTFRWQICVELIFMRFALYDVTSGLLHSYRDKNLLTAHLPLLLPQNSPKIGVNRRFQAKRAKYSNFCIIKTTNAIATKFCTVIKTIKFSLRVVPKFAPQIQNGGWPPSRIDKLLYVKNLQSTSIPT